MRGSREEEKYFSERMRQIPRRRMRDHLTQPNQLDGSLSTRRRQKRNRAPLATITPASLCSGNNRSNRNRQNILHGGGKLIWGIVVLLNQRHSLQLFVVETDKCLVWELLFLPSNAPNLPSLMGNRWRHYHGVISAV